MCIEGETVHSLFRETQAALSSMILFRKCEKEERRKKKEETISNNIARER
jgi:hypothetical protein